MKNLPIIFNFDKGCQNHKIPLHREPIKNDAVIMEILISATMVVAKVAAIGVMLGGCVGMLMVGAKSVIEEA